MEVTRIGRPHNIEVASACWSHIPQWLRNTIVRQLESGAVCVQKYPSSEMVNIQARIHAGHDRV